MKAILKNKNLQLYFSGQIISLIGTCMQQIALSWLVYRLTNSPLMLGLVSFAGQAPSLILTPLAGIVADRGSRQRTILITQILALVQAALLTALVAGGHAQLWQLIVLSVALGVIVAFELPTRQSFLVDMLENNEQLKGAISINSSINTITRLIGPFLAGIFVTYAGEAPCFAANALSYLAVIIALCFVKSKQVAKPQADKNAMEQLKEGCNYILATTPIRDLIVLITFIGLFSMPFTVLMPAFAKDVFHGDATTLGLLTGASSAGSVFGALFLASRKDTRDLTRWIIGGCAMTGLGLMLFGWSTTLPLSMVAVDIVGFGCMLVLAGANTVIQTIVDEDKRGRVMSFVIMALMGMSPFGCMVAGALATLVGVGNTVIGLGFLTLVVAFAFFRRITTIHLKLQKADATEAIVETEAELSALSA